MHIPGKSTFRPKSSRFRFTDDRRLAFANKLRKHNANSPMGRILLDNEATRIESSIGRTVTKTTTNQRKRRAARRQAWAAGVRTAFAA